TVKDAGLNQLYRDRFTTCHRQYSLVCPFMERLVDLCEQPGPDGRGTAGWLGAIVSNAFMKREFGSKLVEEFLPKWDLTHVLNTSGAYIPGHGTPTVILLLRGRKPLGERVRAVMGIRGEPTPPEDPAKGLVWTEIVGLVDTADAKGSFVSVSDVERERFASHPWSLGGGGAAELRDRIEVTGQRQLSHLNVDIGRTMHTGLDEAFYLPQSPASAIGPSVLPLIRGENVRDWSAESEEDVIAPYNLTTLERLAENDLAERAKRILWLNKAALAARSDYGQTLNERGLAWFEWSMFFRHRLATPLGISFPVVATHNHFVLCRKKLVFNSKAPVIKLPLTATEDDHLVLLGLLNSAMACFWMKQVFFPKGGSGIGRGVQDEEWESRFEHDGTKLREFPLTAVPDAVARRAKSLDTLAQHHASHLPSALLA
ncbi:MAG TPA: BREX-2 system adenine-specific DNA-methyltransferase PglX, partial [Polyangiaceae bacterium]|nr:BREX-2 system adenine-specific DNA-methyltransferase PglX [Polyangiaceae bacterium]